MYRSQDITKFNNDMEPDENYEFSGATLKISSNETIYENPNSSNISSQNDGGENTKIIDENTSGIDSSRSEIKTTTENNETTTNEKPKIGSPRHFFSFRPGQFEKAVEDIVNILLKPSNDLNILGKWLLTEISHWDHERERVFILTTKTLLVVKYDFIALRVLHHNKIRLTQIDTIVRGKLTYPESSLVPRIEGITNGVTSIVHGNLFGQRNDTTKVTGIQQTTPRNLVIANRFDFSHFKPVERNDVGIRIMWNRGQPLSFITSWNPFSNEIPWITFKDHPLYSYQDSFNSPAIQENLDKIRQIYSADNLFDKLAKLFSDDANNADVNYSCLFQDEPIIMQNYFGIGAVIHNKNNFGFFKAHKRIKYIPTIVYKNMGYALAGISVNDLCNITFDEISIIKVFGSARGLRNEQLKVIAGKIQNEWEGKTPEKYSEYDLKALGQILCFMNQSDILNIHPDAYKEAAELIGDLEACPLEILQAFAKLAKQPNAFGQPNTWSKIDVGYIGRVILGLDEVDYRLIPHEALQINKALYSYVNERIRGNHT